MGESVEIVARRWASWGEAEMRRSGGGKGVLPPDWPPGVVGEGEPGELRGAVEHMMIRIRESSGEEGGKRRSGGADGRR
jgi:hypothetical protein